MEILFTFNKNEMLKLKSQSLERNELRDKDIKLPTVNTSLQDTKKSLAAPTEKGENQEPKSKTQLVPKELRKSQDLIHKSPQIEANSAQKKHDIPEIQAKAAKPIDIKESISVEKNCRPMEQAENLREIKDKTMDSTNEVEEHPTNDEYEASACKTNNNELENVEVIEFSEEETDESFEDEEMILPDNEEDLLFVDLKENNSKEHENEKLTETEEEESEEKVVESRVDDSKKEIEESQSKIENVAEEISEAKSVENNKNSYDEVEPYELLDLEDNEELMDLADLNESEQSSMKRANSQTNDSNIPKAKKIKTWDPVNDIEMEAAIETVNALADSFLDPLAADDLNLSLNIKNIKEDVDEEQNVAHDDEDDDVEIIETRNSPILIESDEEEMAADDANDVTAENKTDVMPNSTAVLEPKVQPMHEIVISNITSLNHKSKNVSKTIKPPAAQKRKNIPPTAISRQLQQKRSTVDLQPKMICGPNPQLFSTKVGDRNLLIPNAFYGNKNSNTNPDIGHCRWLQNFLRHFCSPFNIAHNTCFLLLQRAIREEDFIRIRQDRLLLDVKKGEVDPDLLRIMHRIFYVNGDPTSQKLSFNGRKFCNLAFVNILDKTISLTVDWRTNGVTSRTRISTATVESVRQQKTSTTSSSEVQAESAHENSLASNDVALKSIAPDPAQMPAPALNWLSQPLSSMQNPTNEAISTASQPSVIPATIIHTTKRIDNDKDAVKTQKRTLRSASRREKVEISNRFIYSDDENAIDSDNDGSDQEFLAEKTASKSKSNKQDLGKVDVSAFVNDYVTNSSQPTTGKPEQGKKATTFEMAFLERLAHEKKDTFVVRAKRKVSTKHATSNTDQTILIIDDDEDVAPKISAKLPLEPRLAIDKPTHHESNDKDVASKTYAKLPLEPRLAIDKPTHPEHDADVAAKIYTKLPLEPRLAIDKPTHHERDDAVDIAPIIYAKLPLDPRLAIDKRVKNTDPEAYLKGNHFNFCLICKLKVNHLVGHYVNMHPDSEVYVSRPTPKYAFLLMENQLPTATFTPARNNLNLFLSTCVFCEKKGAFSMSYWYQHFASHTGEYSYHCTGCGTRKPSRPLLLSHLPSCPKKGLLNIKYLYDCSLMKISAFMCRLCNYTQMNFENVTKHLLNEHGFDRIYKHLWASVTLLELPHESAHEHAASIDVPANTGKKSNKATKKIKSSTLSETQTAPSIIIRDSNGDIFEISEVEDGKSYAVDLTANMDPPPPIVINEAEQAGQMDEVGDVEGIIQAYINRKT